MDPMFQPCAHSTGKSTKNHINAQNEIGTPHKKITSNLETCTALAKHETYTAQKS